MWYIFIKDKMIKEKIMIKTLVKNANLIPELTSNNLEKADILIVDGIIEKIDSYIDSTEADETIHCEKDQFLVPGFIDLHVHLTSSGGDVLYDNFSNDFYVALKAYKFSLDSLKVGFTTLRDVGSNMRSVNSLRDIINNQELIGPTIISSGKILTPTESGNEYFDKMYVECDGVDEIKKSVRTELKKGADYIKIMASGAIMNPGGDPGSPIFTDEELSEFVNTAKLKGTYVAAHAHSSEAIKQCFKAKIRTIEHASIMDEECIELALNSNSTFIVPTATAFMDLVEEDDVNASFINEKIKKFFNEFKSSYENVYKKGVLMGFGTDQGVTGSFHGKNGNEFIYRKELFSMKNIDILKQATIDSAFIAGIDDKVGSIEVGKDADMVVLESDPRKSIEVCRDGIVRVIKKGIVIK